MTVPTEYFRWCIVDERTGKRRKTTYVLTRADAAERYPVPRRTCVRARFGTYP